jgi:DNA-binding NtrC family response regulator
MDDSLRFPASDRPLVLVVDDERVIADTLSAILSLSGYRVATAYNGHRAIEAVMKEAPDLLLSDVVMPAMSGIELAIAVKEIIPQCKILLFSGQANIVDLLAEAREQGYNFPILMKPMPPARILKHISDHLELPDFRPSNPGLSV